MSENTSGPSGRRHQGELHFLNRVFRNQLHLQTILVLVAVAVAAATAATC
jgi:hypothetical protein